MMTKNATADDLHRIIMRKRVTYEQIRRIDPNRFHDLEVTMKMLYDHGPDYNFESADGIEEFDKSTA